jgi:hypothetical protein
VRTKEGGGTVAAVTYSENDLRDRLRGFETEYDMESEDFLSKWESGDLPYTDAFFVWASLCTRLGVRERELA